MSDKKTGLDLMRVPFPENQISLLPKPMKKRDEMDKLPKATCKICGGYHATSMVMHLSYVGHAALTDRLLDADPNWSWEPMALDAQGYPAIDKDGGMWIKLTVCGVTRLGYGDAQGKSGGDAMKERIGDALRNAAMRFGAALDLWHKGDLHVDEDVDGNQPEGKGKSPKELQKPEKSATGGQSTEIPKAHTSLYMELADACGGDELSMDAKLKEISQFAGSTAKMTLDALKAGKPSEKWVGMTLGKLRAPISVQEDQEDIPF